MSEHTASDRLALKTPEASFRHVLESEFNLSYREAREVVSVAREVLGLDRPSGQVRPGQMRLVVASLRAPFGPPLDETARVEVTLTVNAGAEDAAVLSEQGRLAVRRGRMLRLVEEALEQDGVLTEEDLARALQVTRRTIERDVQTLRTAGHLVQTRGQVKGTGGAKRTRCASSSCGWIGRATTRSRCGRTTRCSRSSGMSALFCAS